MIIKLSQDLLNQEYQIHRLYSYQIAQKYGCSATWVNTLRKKYGILTIKPYQRNRKQRLTPKQNAYIYGSMLGDGCIKINKKHKNGNAFLSVGQINKSYVEYQYSIMKTFIKSKMSVRIDKRLNRSPFYYFRTIAHPVFSDVYNKIYPNERKTISKKWLQQLTPFSLAIWYMDDGSITKSTRMMRISTESFTNQENKILINFLQNKWGIRPKIIKSNARGKFLLKLSSSERNKFFTLIDPFIIPEMRYKLYKNYQNLSLKRWNVSEIKFLQENYFGSRINWDKMVMYLNRSRQSISRKASYLVLTNRNQL